MKKTVVFILLAALLCGLCACGGKTVDDEASPKNILNAALTALGMNDRGLVYLSETDNDFEMLDDGLLSGKYGELLDAPTVDMMDKYAVFYAYDSYGTEIGVFRMKTADDAKAMKTFIENRQKRLLENAVNYPDLDTTTVSSLVVEINGVWVYYIMSDGNDIAIPEMEKILYK